LKCPLLPLHHLCLTVEVPPFCIVVTPLTVSTVELDGWNLSSAICCTRFAYSSSNCEWGNQ
jgi:hypothetical protein